MPPSNRCSENCLCKGVDEMARFAMRRMMTSGQLSIVTLNDVSRSSVNHDCAVLPAAEAAAVTMMMMIVSAL